MDIRMPEMDGLLATARIIDEFQGAIRVLILTTFDPDEYVYEALRAGASGFVLKDIPPEQLVVAVRTVAEGGALLAPRSPEGWSRNSLRSEPSARPCQRSWRNSPTASATSSRHAEIAADLFIGTATVKSHFSSVLAKLGLRDRTQIVVFAYESGLVKAGRGASSAHP